MRILILQRVPFQYIGYDTVIDHNAHEVVYVGEEAALETVPAALRCKRLTRPGLGRVSDEVLACIAEEAPFDRLVSMSQFEVMEAGRLRDQLNLPGHREADVLRADNKVVMKRELLAQGLDAPGYLPCQQAFLGQVPSWSGKTVLKPVDGTGSDYVYVFDSYQEALEAAASNSKHIPAFDPAGFELEEFVEGPIWHCDGIILGGEFVTIMPSRYIGTCLDYAAGKPLGSVQMPHRKDMVEATEAFVRGVGMRSAVFHLELIESSRGPVFMEIAARSGGGPIGEGFKRTVGIDLAKAELLIQLDDRPLALNAGRHLLTPYAEVPAQPVSGYCVYPGHAVGAPYVRVVGADRVKTHPYVQRWTGISPDQALPTDTSYFEWELPIWGIFGGPAPEPLDSFIRQVFEQVHVVGEFQPSPR